MFKTLKLKNKVPSSALLLCLLYFVFLDEVADNFLIADSSTKFRHENILVYLMQSLQIVFSSIQAGFSDYYLRRRSLIFSISATLLALIIFRFSNSYGYLLILISIVLKGMLGNTLPIAWASIADLSKASSFRFILALSIFALAVGSWGSLYVIPHLSDSTFFISTSAIVLLGLGLAFWPFKDREDLPKPHFLQTKSISRLLLDECMAIYHLSKKPINALAFSAFLFGEISFYQILFRIEVFNNYSCLKKVPIAIGIGYLIGIIALKFIKASDRIVTAAGLLLSLVSILLIYLFKAIGHESSLTFTSLFIIYSLGYSFSVPALFSLITPKSHPHLQGKMYGIIESVDSLASLLTFILIFNSKNLNCSLVFLTSLVMLLIGVIFFFFVSRRKSSHH